MKFNFYTSSITCILYFIFSDQQITSAQGTWTSKANFGGAPLASAVSFSTNGKGYIATGDDGLMTQNLWQWDKQTNSWISRSAFTGTARIYSASFSIGNTGYVGTGWDGTMRKDFWEWNELNNTWTQKADFGGTARRNAVGFAIGAKGYIGTGFDGAYKKDLWEYNPINNTWTQKADFGGSARGNAAAMVIAGKGYVGTGLDATVSYNDFWEYDPGANAWLQKANFSGAIRYNAVAFSIGTQGYLGTGNNSTTYYQDFWQYSPGSNTWSAAASLPAVARRSAVGFSVGTHGYISTGLDNASNYLDDLWEYTPACNLTISVTVTNATCGMQNGSATVIASNGAGPYTYQWTNGDNGVTADSLASGLYMITVTDAMGCSKTSPAMISDIGSPTVTITSVSNVSCKGGSNGVIDISVSGGSPPYTYNWVNGAATQDVSNLSAGPYQVEVYGNNGCMAMANINVSEPVLPVGGTVAITHATCGSANGTATVTPTGGSAPYTYLWSNNSTLTTTTGLAAGGHTVVVTDVKGCKEVLMVPVVNQGGAVVAVDSIKSANCTSGLGSIYISVTSGTPPYTYSWSNGATTQDLVGVPPGPYALIVYSNGNPCTGAYMGVLPSQLPYTPVICAVSVDSTSGKNECFFVKDSVANLKIKQYNFYRETVVAGQYQKLGSKASNLPSKWQDASANPLQRAWRYKITAEDSCGNESPISNVHKTIHLAANIGVGGNVNLIWDDYEGFSYGTFFIYRFTWATGWDSLDAVPSTLHSYTDLNTPTPLQDVYYYIAVDNPQDCQATIKNPVPMANNLNLSKSNVNRINPTPTGLYHATGLKNVLEVFPNPSSGVFRVECALTGSGNVEVFDLLGKKVLTQPFEKGPFEINLKENKEGVYFLKVNTGLGSVTEKVVIRK